MDDFAFDLPDDKGNRVKLGDWKGKVVFMDFWYTGCGNCAYYYKTALSKVEQHFANNPEVRFVSVAIDLKKEKWIESINSGVYTSTHEPNVTNLYTEGKGTEHPIIKHYRVFGYPRPLLIGRNGTIFTDKHAELRGNGADTLVATINKALAEH